MTARLGAIAADRWADLDGWAVGHGMPPLTDLPVDRFVNFVWWICTRNADQAQTDRFRNRLWQPPPKVAADPRGPWAPEKETSAFAGLKAALSGRPAAPTP